jgi:hypothetical protein
MKKTDPGIGIPTSVFTVWYRRKKCRTVLLYSGTELIPASLVFFNPVPD